MEPVAQRSLLVSVFTSFWGQTVTQPDVMAEVALRKMLDYRSPDVPSDLNYPTILSRLLQKQRKTLYSQSF